MTTTTKKTKAVRVAGAILACALVLTGAMFTTIAKYESEGVGSDAVYTAKWSIDFTEAGKNEANDLVDSGSFTFDLFDETIANYDEAGNDVVKGLIAPGTSGSFAFELTNKSEVTAEYDIQFAATQDNLPQYQGADVNIPIEYRLDGQGEWVTDISKLNIENIRMDIGAEKSSHTVEWRWSFNPTVDGHTDALDTLLGQKAADAANATEAPMVTVNAKIVATQVD